MVGHWTYDQLVIGSTSSYVTIKWMGDCLQTRKPSQYVINKPGQLSLTSLWGRKIKYWLAWLGLRQGVFTCVGWQETPSSGPICQVTFRSPEMGFYE